MRGTVAKRLRKEAADLTRGTESRLVRVDDGSVRHVGFRRVYQELKRNHKKTADAG